MQDERTEIDAVGRPSAPSRRLERTLGDTITWSMLRALPWKEFREQVPILAIIGAITAAVTYAPLLSEQVRGWSLMILGVMVGLAKLVLLGSISVLALVAAADLLTWPFRAFSQDRSRRHS